MPERHSAYIGWNLINVSLSPCLVVSLHFDRRCVFMDVKCSDSCAVILFSMTMNDDKNLILID